jgi:type IV pilus assembly protein PilE
MTPPALQRGITLIEMSVAVAIVGVLASMALPSYQAQLAKARRAEAIQALSQVQLAQEQYRTQNGLYALQLAALPRAPMAGEHYDVLLAAAHPSAYIARARLRGDATRDLGCAEITLTVADGVASHGPSDRCWNR